MLSDMLLYLIPFLTKRALISLGISIATYVGTDTLLTIISTMINTNLGLAAGIVLQMASLYGLPDALALMIGGFSGWFTLQTIKKFNLA